LVLWKYQLRMSFFYLDNNLIIETIFNMENYRELLEEMVKGKERSILPNSSEKHAIDVMDVMFTNSSKSVNMLVGSLNGNVSKTDIYFSSLENMLARGISVRILFMNKPDVSTRVYNLLVKSTNVERRRVNKDSIQILQASIKNNEQEYHFSVFDGQNYRFEEDVVKNKAWVGINDYERAEKLNSIFESAFQKSDNI
jgi:hypothetical protein